MKKNTSHSSSNKAYIPNNSIDDSEDDDEYENELHDFKTNILASLENNINQNKDKLDKIYKKDEIFKTAKSLKGDIKNLHNTIQEILDKQHNEYLNTFSMFMDSIRKELTAKLEKMEKMAEEKKKNNDVKLLKCERDFFRLEAIRLNNICKSFKEKIDELNFKNKLISDELNTLTTKWKESENINKQLLFELENNIQTNKQLEDTVKSLQDSNNIKKEEMNNNNPENIPSEELINQIKILSQKLQHYQYSLKKEKEKFQKCSNELNKIYLDRNRLEGIFNSCVEETKKIIFNRKIKENKGFKTKNKIGFGKYDFKVNYTINFDQFLPNDKKSVLENFVFNDEVYTVLKDLIFSKKNVKKNNMDKNSINQFNFLEPDWKMKEIIENVKDDAELPNIQGSMTTSQKFNSKLNKTGKMNFNSANKTVTGKGNNRITMNLQMN